jgi:hypothetical protein
MSGGNERHSRAVPRCMRINESPLPLPAGALESLVAGQTPGGAQVDAIGTSKLEAFALHTWRLGRRVEGIVDEEAGRIKRQLQDSHKRLMDSLSGLGVTIEDPTYRAYTDGWLEVEVIAWEDPDGPPPEGVEGPWVKQTIRPVIRRGDTILSKGEVVIADPTKVHPPPPTDQEDII